MNTFFLYDRQYIMQQQLLLHQLLQYNQMIALKSAFSFQPQQNQYIHSQYPSEIHTIEHKPIKNEEINDEQSSFELQKSQRISKAIKKQKETKSNIVNSSQQHTQKRIFLSMKDIKHVQYKKSKITNDNKNKEIEVHQEEKN